MIGSLKRIADWFFPYGREKIKQSPDDFFNIISLVQWTVLSMVMLIIVLMSLSFMGVIGSIGHLFSALILSQLFIMRLLSKKYSQSNSSYQEIYQLFEGMIESLGQGLLLFGEDGICKEARTKACLDLLEKDPRGKPIWEVLGLQDEEATLFKEWVRVIFSGTHHFRDLSGLAPEYYDHSAGRKIHLLYFPLYEGRNVKYIVLEIIDETREFKAKQEAKKERSQANMVLKMAKNGQLYLQFDETFKKMTNELKAQFESPHPDYQLIQHYLHSLKGGSYSLSMIEVSQIIHELEDVVAVLKTSEDSLEITKKKQECDRLIDESISAYKDIIKQYQNIIGKQFTQEKRFRKIPHEMLVSFYDKIQKKFPYQELRNAFINMFFEEPIVEQFYHFEEMVQRLANETYKEINPIKFKGIELKLNATPYYELIESLTHAFRNAVDHGIEYPHKRIEAGKDPKGQIIVEFEELHLNREEWIRISIKDDGKGINPDEVRNKLRKMGKADIADSENDRDIIQHIFDEEFSTASKVTQISGRGVGMETIIHNASELGGKAYVESHPGRGTTVTIEVPKFGIEQFSSIKAASH